MSRSQSRAKIVRSPNRGHKIPKVNKQGIETIIPSDGGPRPDPETIRNYIYTHIKHQGGYPKNGNICLKV